MAATKGRAGRGSLATKIDPEFGSWLKEMRRARGFTMDDLCTLAGLHRTTITGIENNWRTEAAWTVEIFVRLAKAFELELGYVLLKAGFDIGPEGLDMARLQRVEDIIDAFQEHESELRLTIAEAMEALNHPTPDGNPPELVAKLGTSLLAIDLLAERTRVERYMGRRVRKVNEDVAAAKASRQWSEHDLAYMAENPGMSHRDMAAALGRSEDAVRIKRRHMNNNKGDQA